MSEATKQPGTYEKHENIYSALSAFQGELKPMPKSGHVEFQTSAGKTVKYDYTPLGEIMATIYPLLAKHGLSVRHEITDIGVEAILTHETYRRNPMFKIVNGDDDAVMGASEPGKITEFKGNKIEKIDNNVQNELRSGIVKVRPGSEMKDTGAAITYARRYTLTMVLGISSEDDKDAELLEQTAKNAIQSSYERMKKGIEAAKTPDEVDKAMKVIKKDLEAISKAKAPALGLSKEQYLDLTLLAENMKRSMEENAGEGK